MANNYQKGHSKAQVSLVSNYVIVFPTIYNASSREKKGNGPSDPQELQKGSQVQMKAAGTP